MKIKKAIVALHERILSMTEAQAQEEIQIILNSFELQIRYGCSSKLTAFSNSIYTPTTKKNEQKEAELKEQKKKLTYAKYRTALRHEELIKNKRKEGSSYQQIADFLNQYVVHHKKYFNKKYIERFCKDRSISSKK
ncbi:hypothetical protein [Sulfurimonas sp.]|uniref:hypothetical protein n=1 Tax=Sulfurimonas sp. TaxID=2022749 RepID=UPI003D13CFCE